MTRKTFLACAINITLGIHASAAFSNEFSCDPMQVEPYIQKIAVEQARDVMAHELFSTGHYSLVVDSFVRGLTHIDDSTVGMLLHSLYRSRQICPDLAFSAPASIQPYVELISMLENVLEASELEFLIDMWSEKYRSQISSDIIESHLFEVFGLSAVSRVQTILLHMNAGAESAGTKSIMKSLQALGIQIIFVDAKSDASLDQLIDEHTVDLIVSDATPLVSASNLHKVFLIGKVGDNSWSMSFEKEISYALDYLAQHEKDIRVYSMIELPFLGTLMAQHPNMTLHQFKDFDDANRYFKAKICSRESEGCVSELNNKVSFVIGNTKQTSFINSFVRVAQDTRHNKKADAKVYITSAATWGGITDVERQDLSNTLIFDAKRLSSAGAGFTQSDRITALIRDIISIYENQSVGVNYSDIPYLGYSGTYFIRNGNVSRDIDLIEFRKHAGSHLNHKFAQSPCRLKQTDQ